MNQVIGEVLPLAVAVLISPIPIAAEILLLFSQRPRPNALAYVVGFLAGVGIGLGILTAVAGATDLSSGGSQPGWAAWLRIVLGALLVLGGIRRFRGRPPRGEGETPGWMDGIEGFTPGRSLVVGLGIGALNPKNIVVGIGAAVTISSGLAGDPVGSSVVVVVAYAVFASLGVMAPLVVALVMGSRADTMLRGWRVWLVDNNAAVVAVILFVIGAVLVGKGVAAL